MSASLNLDMRGRAELLTYLVISQLLVRASTSEWLSPEHTVESTRRWLSANGTEADPVQRARLSSCAPDLAERVVQRSPAVLNREIFVTLFTENLQVDFRSEMVREIYQLCLDYLVGIGWVT